MDPLRTYDYLTLARRRILDQVRPLSPDDYRRELPIGLGTIGRTLTHIMISEWYYVQRLRGRDVPPYKDWPIRQESPPPLRIVEHTWTEQARDTREALAEPRDWAAAIEYRVIDDAGLPKIVTATGADLLTQLILHEAHHRAQIMNMLRQVGVAAEDVDFNELMFARRERR